MQVYPRNSSNGPAFQVGFTSVSFDVPGDAQFVFNPPPGAKVTEGALPTGSKPSAGDAAAHKGVRTVGTGWTTVAVLPGPTTTDGALSTFLNQLQRGQRQLGAVAG